MSRFGIEQRIFVVGVPRSGTTLVQSLLAAHSRVTSFTESHFFSICFRPISLPPGAILTRDPNPRLREFLTENDFAPGTVASTSGDVLSRAASLPRCFLPLKTRAVAGQLLRVLDEMAWLRGRSIWIEKTPRHLCYIPFLERLGKGERSATRFVHVIRRGVDVVASLHRASQSWERPYGIETCVERWNTGLDISRRRLRSAAKDLFVVYEDLTARPEATLQRLLPQLGLEWEPGLLDRYASGSGRWITPEETWKAKVGSGVVRSAAATQALSEAQRKKVGETLHHDLYTQIHEHTSD